MPARTPDYTPLLVEPLLDQFIAILQRDFLANLKAVNAAAGYAVGFNVYHKTEQDMYPNAPEALVEPIESPFDPDEQELLASEHVFAVSGIVSGDGDTEALAQKARDYARALVWTLGRRGDYSDYMLPLPITRADGTTGTTTGTGAGVVKGIVLRHVGWSLKGTVQAQLARQPIVEIGVRAVE